MKYDVVQLTRRMVEYPSESQTSNIEVTECIIQWLTQLKFKVERIPYKDKNGINKLSIVAKMGTGIGGLTLMSHNDVVPALPYQYKPTNKDGRLYGRGSCDMKGPLAATICAAAQFKGSDLKKPLYIVVTADEEIQAVGARMVTEKSKLFAEASKGYGIICEPTRLNVVYAHKGSLSIIVTSKGRAAHTSTLRGTNANIRMIPFLQDMNKIYDRVIKRKQYRNLEFDPPHSEWSIGINDHNIATNISPKISICTINYRPMPGVDVEPLIKETIASAKKNGLKCEVRHVGDPVYTQPSSTLVKTALRITGKRKARTVPYGTDGMAFVKKMKDLVVIGPGDISQAHTVDEWIDIGQLKQGVDLYARFINHVCVNGRS
ncbi:MAG: M20/M25/M40 family metallo-hydrolase [Candidatus Latescibacterota bacterium]|nr:M20/M25/M40 family metallo-hydrolase [Candidatus Latescibacterota bacterium]